MGCGLSPQASDPSWAPEAALLSAHCKPTFSWSLLVRRTECHSHALQTQVCREKRAQMTITPDCWCLICTSWRVGFALLVERQRAPLIRDTCNPRPLRHPTLAAVAILLLPHMNISPLWSGSCSACNACDLAPKSTLLSIDVGIIYSTGSKESGCFHSWNHIAYRQSSV